VKQLEMEARFFPEFALSKRSGRNDKVKDAGIKRRGASKIFWIPDQVGNDSGNFAISLLPAFLIPMLVFVDPFVLEHLYQTLKVL